MASVTFACGTFYRSASPPGDDVQGIADVLDGLGLHARPGGADWSGLDDAPGALDETGAADLSFVDGADTWDVGVSLYDDLTPFGVPADVPYRFVLITCDSDTVDRMGADNPHLVLLLEAFRTWFLAVDAAFGYLGMEEDLPWQAPVEGRLDVPEWAWAFGADALTAFGPDKVRSAPAHRMEEIDGGVLLFNSDTPAVGGTEDAVLAHLNRS
jgi:hypothetical protein